MILKFDPSFLLCLLLSFAAFIICILLGDIETSNCPFSSVLNPLSKTLLFTGDKLKFLVFSIFGIVG